LASRTNLIVSVINHATPVFTQQFYGDISVSENAQLHTVVSDAVKASSPDGSDIHFTIEDGDPFQQFDIDFETGLSLCSLAKTRLFNTQRNIDISIRLY